MSELSDIRAERDRLRAALVVVRTVMRAQGWHIAAENEDVSAETAGMVLGAYEAVVSALDEQRSESGGAARHVPCSSPDSAQAERGAADGVEIMDEWDFGFPREILDSDQVMIGSCRDRAREAASSISWFPWSWTEEGFDYWCDVRNRLFRISREGH